ncbi:MAG TPA: sigma-70 family RNA polymerase sigma factor [Saprospirales bacterium]|nr:sigma-70 family RNA polymerase sigma factor [Saprospirales bacterium]
MTVTAVATRKTSSSAALSDSQLIALYLRDQDARYFSQLYRRYAGKVFAKCISMLADHGMAKDATQDVFIKVLLNLSKFTEHSAFSTWVYSITYNYCIDLIRKKKKNILIFSEDVGRISKETEIDIPDSVILEMETNRLDKVMDKLPVGDKAILNMKYIDDMSIKEIGDVLDKTESAIKMQIMRAKIRAQSIYEDMYGKEPISME